MLPRHMMILIFAGLIISPLQVHAGLADIYSIYEAILPPAILWISFVVIWYLAVAAAATRHGDAIGGVPPLPKAMGVLLFAAFLGLTMIGPAAILYLLLFFPAVTVKAFFQPQKSPISSPAAIMLRRISIVSTLVLAGLVVSWVYIHSHRSKAEFLQRLGRSQAMVQYLQHPGFSEASPDAGSAIRVIAIR